MITIPPQKLNVLSKPNKKFKHSICIDNERDKILCTWASENNIVNHYGTANRSAAIAKLIDMIPPQQPEKICDEAQNGNRGKRQ